MSNKETNMSNADAAKAIRNALKTERGWTSRQVSVRSRHGTSVDVTIKDASIPSETVKAIADQAGTEARYVFTSYKTGALSGLAAVLREELPRALEGGYVFGCLAVIRSGHQVIVSRFGSGSPVGSSVARVTYCAGWESCLAESVAEYVARVGLLSGEEV